uniref:Uncharacterized protein n=1 Tax=Steinernema glaseri TaxID=37863 RepID=A0A1I8AFC7_9BILA
MKTCFQCYLSSQSLAKDPSGPPWRQRKTNVRGAEGNRWRQESSHRQEEDHRVKKFNSIVGIAIDRWF